jgi:hypothetical protein
MGKNFEGSGCGLIQGAALEFVWSDWGKLQKISVKIADILAEI